MEKAMIRKNQIRGIEGMEAEDLLLPRVLLMQASSKFVSENDAKPGSFVSSLTKHEIPTNEFIPVIFSKYWDLYHKDADDPNNMIYDGRTFEHPGPDRKYFSDEEGKADAVAVLSFISLVGKKPMLIGFSKSSYGSGKKLLTYIQDSETDSFSKKYKLVSHRITGTKPVNGRVLSWFASDVEQAGDATAEEYDASETLYQMFSKRIKDLHSDGMAGERLEAEKDVPF